MGIIQSVFLFLRVYIMARAVAAAENLALRQQRTEIVGTQNRW